MFGEKKEKENVKMILQTTLGVSIVSLILLIVLLVLSFRTMDKKISEPNEPNKTDIGINNNLKEKENGTEEKPKFVKKEDTNKENTNYEKLKVTFIEDSKAPQTKVKDFAEGMKKDIPSFANAEIVIKDFRDEEVKKFVKDNKIDFLPAVVFSTKNFDSSKDPQDLKGFLKELPNGEFILNIGATYDPLAENCSNSVDDNEDGKVDCEDEKCSKDLACAPKVDKPKAELFIMSYCPFGTQAEKGFLEAMLKLDKVADMKIRFVNYLMHGEKEGEENIVQYCIQKEQQDKFKEYLKCFLASGDNKKCLDEAKIDKNKLNTCIKTTKESINYDKNIGDKSKRFPLFSLDNDDNEKYSVQGSPTFVLNGIKVERVGRSAKAYADLICSTFKNKPKVCEEEFKDVVYDPNFGFTTNGQTVSGACGG